MVIGAITYMGAVFISLFVFPATITDGISGAFYYTMVPLSGIGWVVLAANMGLAYVVYQKVIRHGQKDACKS